MSGNASIPIVNQGQGCDSDSILDLTMEMARRDDPREALFNDYHDRVRSAADTIALIVELRLLPKQGGKQDWWTEFFDSVVEAVVAEGSSSNTYRHQ
jgi:hypothetical protein